MRHVQIICDNCKSDLTHCRRLLLSETLIQPRSGNMVFAIGLIPELEDDLYFCHLICLKKWAENE